MKKLLSVLMAVMMLVSSVAVIGASAAEGYAAKNPITDSFSTYDEFVAENADKEIYGYTYDMLYENRSTRVDWTKIDIRYEKMGFPAQSTPQSISLALGNMNSYLKRVVTAYFLGDKLYTEEYAVKLINFFGRLIDPKFVPVTECKLFDTNTTPNDHDFYEAIGVESGLADMIQTNWCNVGVDFKGFLTVFGVDLSDVVNSDFGKGKPVARALIQGVIETILGIGPLEYAIRIIESFSAGADGLYNAATSLFSMKIAQGKLVKRDGAYVRELYSPEELHSVQGLLNFALDGVIDYDFFKFPDAKMILVDGAPERLLCLMMYFAINYRHNENAVFVDNLAGKINSFLVKKSYTAGYTAEQLNEVTDNITMMVDIIFKGDISLDDITALGELTQVNLEETPEDIKTQIRNWFSKLLRKIADYFDYLFKLFTGEIKYGESIID